MLSGLKRKLLVLDFNHGNSPIYFISQVNIMNNDKRLNFKSIECCNFNFDVNNNSQVFGQMPYSVTIIKNKYRIRLSFNMFTLGYSIICFALYCFSLYTFISESYKSLYDFPAISRIGIYLFLWFFLIISKQTFFSYFSLNHIHKDIVLIS